MLDVRNVNSMFLPLTQYYNMIGQHYTVWWDKACIPKQDPLNLMERVGGLQHKLLFFVITQIYSTD